jgi:hypothetical protein
MRGGGTGLIFAAALALVACDPALDGGRGEVVIHAGERHGDLYVDALEIGPAHATNRVTLERGVHVAELRRGATVIASSSFEVRPGVATEVRLVPVAWIADAAVGGRLEVSSVPAGATVFVDGVRAGLSPLAIDLPAGAHRVELVAPHTHPHDEEILIGVGVATSIEVRLEPSE